MATGKLTATLEGIDRYGSHALAFSMDGKAVWVGFNEGIKWWNLVTGASTATQMTEDECVRAGAFSPDAKSLAVAKDGSVSLVVTNEGRQGTATTLVLLDHAGNILDKSPVTVGE